MEAQQRTIVVKLGGSTLGGGGNTSSPATTLEDLLRLAAANYQIVLVHGGGNATSDLIRRLGQEPRFQNGLRVTDADALQAATMMLRGVINAQLVQEINSSPLQDSTHPVLAVGMAGVDGRMLEARRDTAHGDLGFVGDVVKVNLPPLLMALEWGFMPVVAPLGFAVDDAEAKTFNLNADHAAAKIAAALEADACVFLTDVPGVLDNNKKTIKHLTVYDSEKLIADGTISGGMIPKIESAMLALEGAKRVLILDGRQPGALYDAVEKFEPNGTTMIRRIKMGVTLQEPFELANNLPYRIEPAPQNADELMPFYYDSYMGTLDFDWDNINTARAELETIFDGAMGQYLPAGSFVVKDGDKIAGAALMTLQNGLPHFVSISLLPEYRGQGLARQLIYRGVNHALAIGYQQATLYVTRGNDVAVNLYKRLGFQELP